MNDESRSDQRRWLASQIDAYEKLLPRYRRYAEVLREVLEGAVPRVAPLSLVQSRAKTIASVAEKILRKGDKYAEPLHHLTDLCGVRVITRTRSGVEAVSRYAEEHFDIDWENSVDTSQRLGSAEFGYRSVHYIVTLRADTDYGVALPNDVQGLKAELQVRTFAEHAWADFAHDLSYKGAFELPRAWLRELAGLAASLEEIDRGFVRMEERLRPYASSYGGYLSDDERLAELDRLRLVLEHDPANADLAARAGKLAIQLGDWPQAIEILSPHVREDAPDATHQPVLRDLGVALCKLHHGAPEATAYRRGQRYLELASEPRHADADAVASLAGTWKGIDDELAGTLYRRACEIDPTDPYASGNQLEFELGRNPELLSLVGPLVREPMQRRLAQAEVGVDLPWAFYDLGKFHLLLGEPYASLEAYAKAVELSSAPFMIETSLASLERLGALAERLRGYAWVERLLWLGLAARFPSPESRARLEELTSAGCAPLRAPVVIVAGGTDPRIQQQMRGYEDLVLGAFAGFEGTLVSGGTREGVSGLVGDVGAARGGQVHTLGYLPRKLPSDATVDEDRGRYAELRYTEGEGFSPLEPLQSWIDIVVSDIAPREVRVLGINGGAIAGAEYRIALALGATVGLVMESGREAGRALADERWASSESLVALPRDRYTLRRFVGSSRLAVSAEVLDRIARAIHEAYLQQRRGTPKAGDPSLLDWEALPEDLKQSNREQAAHIAEKLREIGAEAVPRSEAAGEGIQIDDDAFERMAEMEHGRWNAEKLLDGWCWGEERSRERKTSPYLVSWTDLPEEIKAYDRSTVRRIPELLVEAGLEIRPRRSKHI